MSTQHDWWPAIIRHYGSQQACGKALGIGQTLVSYYVVNGYPPKAEWCHLLSQDTGLTLHQLRPDLWKRSHRA